MYETVETVQRIKRVAKEKGVKTTQMLEACELSKNALSSMNNRGSWIQANSLAKIADYLECSVDYLLGRTENPNIMSDVYVNGNNHGIQTIKGNVNIGTMSQSKESNDITQEFMEVFEKLTLADKADAIKFVLDKMKK